MIKDLLHDEETECYTSFELINKLFYKSYSLENKVEDLEIECKALHGMIIILFILGLIVLSVLIFKVN